MRIYVASSWRNDHQPSVVHELRNDGHQVYDFRHPAEGVEGFGWGEISENWKTWTPEQFRVALEHRHSVEGFRFDKSALDWCDACVMVQPCGVSSALELGYCAGRGKRTATLLHPTRFEPELMLKLGDRVFTTLKEVRQWLLASERPWAP